jgi:SulP family sulfate permease
LRPPRPLFDMPDLPDGVVIFRIHGPFFFGAASELSKVTSRIGAAPRLLILDFQDVPLLDSTGAASLKGIFKNALNSTTQIVLTAVQPQVARNLERYGVNQFGYKLVRDIPEALKHLSTAT